MVQKRSPFFFTFLNNYRFGLLFVSLLLTLGGSAIMSELGVTGASNVLILINSLLLLVVVSGRLILMAGLFLFAVFVLSLVFFTLTGVEAFTRAGEISVVILLVLGTLACFRDAFRRGPVDRERLAAALSLYLLLGLVFAMIFRVFEELLPGSLHFSVSQSSASEVRPLADMVYFSFVTLATLGYGDIVPLTPAAKGLAILEAIIGQMYLVVVVARLVSLYGSSESR